MEVEKQYTGYPKEGNQNALFILLKILERITEQFVMREVEKQEKKERQAALQAVSGAAQAKLAEPKVPAARRPGQPAPLPQVSRAQGKLASFAKYFESSNEDYGDEEESEQEEEEESAGGAEEAKQPAAAVSSSVSEGTSRPAIADESD